MSLESDMREGYIEFQDGMRRASSRVPPIEELPGAVRRQRMPDVPVAHLAAFLLVKRAGLTLGEAGQVLHASRSTVARWVGEVDSRLRALAS